MVEEEKDVERARSREGSGGVTRVNDMNGCIREYCTWIQWEKEIGEPLILRK